MVILEPDVKECAGKMGSCAVKPAATRVMLLTRLIES